MSEPQLPDGFKLIDTPQAGPKVPAGFTLMPQIDFNRPYDAVHGDVWALPDGQRQNALREWADYEASKRGSDAIPQIRVPIVSPLAEKAVAAVNAGISKLAHGGDYGQLYDEKRAMQEGQLRRNYADHPVMTTAGNIAGGVLLPIPGSPAATAVGRIGQAAGIGGTVAAGDAYLEGDTPNVGDRLEHAAKAAGAGIVLGGAIGGAGETARIVRQAWGNRGQAGAYNEFANALPDKDVGTFANQVATGATRNDQAINRRTLDVLGREMAATPADRVGATARAVDRLVREDGITQTAAKDRILRLSNVNRDSELFLAEAPAAAPGNSEIRAHVNPAKVDIDAARQIADSGTHWQLDTLANNAGQSATTVRNAVTARQADQPQVMRDVIDSLAPKTQGRPMTIEDTPQIIDAARAAARQAYAKAEQSQQPFNDRLEHVLDVWYRSLKGQQSGHADAVRAATDLFRNEVPIAVNPMTGAPQGKAMVTIGAQGSSANPLKDFVHRRGQLNDLIEKSMDQFGQPTALTRDLTRMKSHIDNAVGVRNPDWMVANRQWADMKLDQVGQRLGDAFSVKAGPQFRAQMREYDGLAPQAREIVNVHFLQKLKDRLDNLGDGHDVSKIFNSAHVREMINKMFGPQATVQLIKSVRDAHIATRTSRMMAGSPTAARQMRASQMDAETGILAAVDQASVSGIRNAALRWVMQRLSESRRQALANVSTTYLKDTAAVARHIHMMRQAQERSQALAQPGTGASTLAGVTGGAVGYPIAASDQWERRRTNAR